MGAIQILGIVVAVLGLVSTIGKLFMTVGKLKQNININTCQIKQIKQSCMTCKKQMNSKIDYSNQKINQKLDNLVLKQTEMNTTLLVFMAEQKTKQKV